MRKLIAALTVCLAPCAIAPVANVENAGEVQVLPGYWNWSHKTRLAAIEFTEENTECLPEDKAQVSLQDLAEDLDQNCSLSDVIANESGYDFTLTCNGFYAGEATGSMTKLSDTDVMMQAAGRVVLAGVSADFDFEAQATRVGTCPAG